MNTLTPTRPTGGRFGASLRSHLTPMPGVPAWVHWTAIAAALTPLPAAIWRLALGFGFDVGFRGELGELYAAPGWITLYVIILAVLNDAVAYLAVGLVKPWGEVWPRWIPFLRGRRVHPLAAIVPAALGTWGLALIVVDQMQNWDSPTNMGDPGAPHGWRATWMLLSYMPMVAWPALLGVVTVAYGWRRRHELIRLKETRRVEP